MGGVVLKNPKTGEEQFFNASEIPKAVRDGWIAAGPGGIPLVNNDGSITTISPDALTEAALGREGSLNVGGEQLARQRREARETEIAFGDAPIRAGALGLARGATFGLSDVVGGALGFGEEISDFRSANPGVSAGGEIVGALGTGLLSGGSGFAARAARLTPTGQLTARTLPLAGRGTFRHSALAGAIEGSVYATGQGLGNLAITDVPFTAEAFFDVAKNTLLGAGLGVAGGIVGEGLLKAGSKLGKIKTSNTAGTLDDATVRTTTASINNKLGTLRKIDDELNSVIKRDVLDLPAVEGHFFELKEYADDLLPVADILGAKVKKEAIAVLAAEKRIAKLFGSDIDEIGRSRVLFKGDKTFTGADLKRFNSALNGYKAAVDRLARKADAPRVNKLPDSIDFVKTVDLPDDTINLIIQNKSLKKNFQKAFALSDEMQMTPASFKKLQAMPVEKLVKNLEDYSAYIANSKQIAQVADATEAMSGVAAVEQTFSGRLANTLEEFNNSVINAFPESSSAAEILAIYGVSEAVLPEVLPPEVDNIAKIFLAYKLGTSLAKTKGKRGFLEETIQQARQYHISREGAKIGADVLGGPNTASGRAGKALGFGLGMRLSKGNLLPGLANTANNAANSIKSSVSKFLKGSGKVTKKAGHVSALAALNAVSFVDGKKSREKDLEKSFNKRVEEITNVISSIDEFNKRVHDNAASVRETHMATGDAIVGHQLKVAQFLASKLPQDPGMNIVYGKSKFKQPPSKMREFANYYFGATQPLKFIEQAFAGKMNAKAAEAFRALYPGHLAKIQEEIVNNITKFQELPYKKRVNLTLMFQVPIEPLVRMLPRTQQSFVDSANEGIQQPQAGATLQANPPTKAQELQAR